ISPETIYSGLKSREISKNIAIDQLISLIEGSNNPKFRSDSISILNNLNIHDVKIFKVIETSLLSDEAPIVRSSAMNLIGRLYLREGLNSLIWVVQHDKSPLVIKALFDLHIDLNDSRLKLLKQELNNYLENIAETIRIVRSEARFILDLEGIFASTEENYQLEINSYKLFSKIRDDKLKEFWLTVKHNHIEALSFNYFNWKYLKQNPRMFDSISNLQEPLVYLDMLRKYHLSHINDFIIPKSISRLTKLKKLNLSKNNIRFLPKSFFLLSKLRYLDLSYNMLTEIPKEITILKFLNTLRLQGNHISEIPKPISEYLDRLDNFKI
ncbi:MAG: leucine-rich repeat domain-containing protein, partial [Candidatus Hermodarchaeota archaeon]